MPTVPLRGEKPDWAAELRTLRGEPQLLAVILLIFALFAVFVLYPFARLLLVPTAEDWSAAMQGRAFLEAFWHTLASSLLAASTAMLAGFLYAYAMQYVEMPGRRFFQATALLFSMAPPMVTGLAFLLLFGPRGFVTWHLFASEVDLCGWIGLWAVQSIAFFPLAYRSVSRVFQTISPHVELAAQDLGARGFYRFRTVTLRLAAPGLVSAFLFLGIQALADFGNPFLVGAKYHVLTTEVYAQVVGTGQLSMGAVLAAVLLIPSLAVFFLQRSYLEKFSYGTVADDPMDAHLRDAVHPAVKWLLVLFCSLVCALLFLVGGVVVLFSFTRALDGGYTFSFASFFEGALSSSSLLNSWLASMTAAVATTLLGIVLAFLTLRRRFPGRRLMDFLTMLPVSLPGIFIGLSLLAAFSTGSLAMTGTFAILVVGMALRQLPAGYRQALAAISKIKPAIEQASTNLGADSFTTFCKVVVPILKNSLSLPFFHAFLRSMHTISTVIFLVSPAWPLASVDIVRAAGEGALSAASGVAVGMMGLTCATFCLAKLVLREKFDLFNV